MPRRSKKAVAAKQREAAKGKPKYAKQLVNNSSTHVTTVLASHWQGDERYEVFSRGVQCTCNSLTFLAVHSENNDLTSLNLDQILTQGDAVYTHVKQSLLNEGRFQSNLLTFDELPCTVETDSQCYSVIKHPQRFGFLRDEAPQGMEEYVNLERALNCLRNDVTDALLITGGMCVAVFRDRSGRFGFFDPHCRTPDGLTPEENAGTAVMLTFANLEDMTERLLILYQVCLKLKDNSQYELLPVSFLNFNIAATTATTDNLEREVQIAVDPCPNLYPDTSQFVEHPVAKLSKPQKRRQYYQQKCNKKKDQSIQTEAENKRKLNLRNKYANDPKFREKRKQSNRLCYTKNVSYIFAKQNSIRLTYMDNTAYKEKQKLRVVNSYRNNPDYREKQKQYIKNSYRNNIDYREKQKKYIKNSYRNNPDYREKQKQYIKNRYRNNQDYRERQRQYIINNYQKEAFRRRQKQYFSKRYRTEQSFSEQKKHKFKSLYQTDLHFRMIHREQCLLRLKNRASRLKTLHKIHCAQQIQRKYRLTCFQQQRNTPVQTQNNESLNPEVQKALVFFKEIIKAGPSYICTVCHRALFSDQVRLCDHTNYQKKTAVASNCLTGKYVHTCSSDCNDNCAPEEMKHEWICHSCHDNLSKGRMPSIAFVNKLQLTPIPVELCDLNILERHVIAKYVCFAKIISLPKGQQRAIKGAVVSVPSDVETTVNVLPRPSSESQLLTVKLKRRLCYSGHYQFQTISMQKVLSALLKLKEIHSEYRDIVVNNVEQDELFDDFSDPINADDIPEYEIDLNMNFDNDDSPEQNLENEHDIDNEAESTEQSTGLALDTCLQPPDLGQHLLSFNDGIFCIAPAERNNPVSMFKVPKLEAMAFPVQFPSGENTFDEPDRHIALSPSRYFNARLFSADNRFARDTNYIFFAQFVTETHQATSSMSIQLRKAKSVTCEGRKINSALLQDKRELDKLIHNNEGTRFMQPLRGTPAYWEKTLRDLFAMLRQLGTPTFFCTFSAAEMRWPEVITAIKAQQGESVDFSALDWSEKCEILRSNPVTAMRMFEKRVEALMNLIQSPAQPIGQIADFFFRIEFQQRGSPHIHCLFWVKGAPEFENDQDQDVCDFIDRHISCKLPDPNTDPELNRIVSEVQTHSRNHSKSCKKNNKHCRFGFPKPPMKKTLITRPRPPPDTDSDDEGAEKDEPVIQAKSKLQPVWDLLNDKTQNFRSITQLLETVKITYNDYKDNVNSLSSASVVIMQREPNDCWVNGYNPLLLRAWNANMDIQYILNPYTCIMYILSYISKGEHEMSEYLKGVIKDMCPTTSERESMKQVMHAYSKNREVSTQEAVARTCSLKLKSSSRAVIFIPTDDNAVKMSLPMSCLQDKAPDDENVWMTGLAEKYMARPETPEFENMCMAEFASEYRVVYGDQKKGKKVLPLQNDMGHIKKRTRGKPAIIRFARFSQQKHPEKFYGTLLKLYLPHRSSSQLKTTQFNTYEAFYAFASVKLPGTDTLQRVYTTVNENRKKYEKHSETIDKAVENFEQNGPIEDAWTNLAPTNELIRLECMVEQEPTDPTDITEADDVPDFAPSTSDNRTAMPVIEAPQVNPAVIRKMYQSLNETQAAVFYKIRDWCKRKVQNENPEPFFYYVAGTAGTGKSHLIKSVYAEATKILQKLPCVREEADISKPTVLLSAVTGCASHKINGKTLHALLFIVYCNQI
ncbi:uncharacterized protein LOC111190042 [Astyanax mexicanus]|uniref:uncharacterized protein LOC111190042 n=1 Tax=Astyanax mexicanus TaxID=7994 RepID=UPI0020CB1590|nr:uncharacterized protein LOC111190042 [Astyanax mexicanus]